MPIKDSVPPRYESALLSQVDPRIQTWINDLTTRKKEGLYLYGDCGTGKTHTAYAILKNSVEQSKRCRFYSSTELLREIKDFYAYPQRYDYDPLTTALDYEGPMILDDLGAEKATEWAIETIYLIINKRYDYKLPTIITSNYTLDQLAERIGDRNTSRIAGMCEVIKLQGEDKRL